MFYHVCFSGTPFSCSVDLFILTATAFAPTIYKAVTPAEMMYAKAWGQQGRRSDLLLPFAGGCPHASAYINGACMPIIRSG
ncbi:hypothetical protein AB205_0012870 [Aquarana catesbeiana]|uniref:Uncharacterized protein n=1 Tax=Aquarana catesbeiana TaxID=8400 RepID=A0A2G9Q6A7_AQUCT|nr:hypothetical protein AB205_0012870 [Aquarana catesbeiana]